MTEPQAGLPRILVVEDDALIGALLTELLQDLGYDVCPVETTESGAVSAAALHKPDLMIVDLGLTDGSGPSAMARIGKAGRVPHIFMSGDRSQPVTPGIILLHKPFRRDDLVQAIKQTLGGAIPNGAV